MKWNKTSSLYIKGNCCFRATCSETWGRWLEKYPFVLCFVLKSFETKHTYFRVAYCIMVSFAESTLAGPAEVFRQHWACRGHQCFTENPLSCLLPKSASTKPVQNKQAIHFASHYWIKTNKKSTHTKKPKPHKQAKNPTKHNILPRLFSAHMK